MNIASLSLLSLVLLLLSSSLLSSSPLISLLLSFPEKPNIDFALSFKSLHYSDVKATAHFCSLFPSFLPMSLDKSSLSQVFPSGKSGATFLRMSIVLATYLAFSRFAFLRVFCFLFLDFLFIAEWLRNA